MDDHPKHLQLGLDLTDVDEDPEMLTEQADFDVVWSNVTTVEQYKADIETLAAG